MAPVIKVENLSKYYRLGLIGGGTLREDLQRWWARVRGWPDPLLKVGMEDHGNREGGEIWALRDVSFEVQEGEILGIIGRNGAGKSTLLKILSRITAPTSGRALIKGRVGSLLEVGTGFHGELTGRENIYLNGSILGMRKWEIDRKLDEIIAFSEIDKFIDTPVKRYSSGMYVRLAFAVAAHLEPEILIVDEVLAVGDAAFQKKCLGKMEDVAGQGRTVLFVSHNMAAMQNLCQRAVMLRQGFKSDDGPVESVVERYLYDDERIENKLAKTHLIDSEIKSAQIIDFDIQPNPPRTGQPLEFMFSILRASGTKPLEAELAVSISTVQGVPLLQLYSQDMGKSFRFTEGISRIKTTIKEFPLAPGHYSINLWLGRGSTPIDWLKNCILLAVHPGELEVGHFVGGTGYPLVISSDWQRDVLLCPVER